MKSQNFILRVLVTAIIGLLVWWFLRPTPKPPEKTAAAPALNKIEAPKPLASSQIAKPFAPPVQLNSQTTASAPPTPAPTDADPQADLKTAIPDIVRLYRAGDFAEVDQTYTPPEKLDLQSIQKMQDALQELKRNQQQALSINPQMAQAMAQNIQQIYERAAQPYEALENQTPTFNAAGDEATYLMTGDGIRAEMSKTFIKINGKWYIKPNDPSN